MKKAGENSQEEGEQVRERRNITNDPSVCSQQSQMRRLFAIGHRTQVTHCATMGVAQLHTLPYIGGCKRTPRHTAV